MRVRPMDILVFSDSHGRGARMEEAYRRQPTPPDAVFFLGDGLRDFAGVSFDDTDVYAVRGNCDFASFSAEEPEERLVRLGGFCFCLMHGHRYGVKSGVTAAAEHAARAGADVLLFGHTHEALEETLPAGTHVGSFVLPKPLLLFNPGSIGEGYPASFGVLVLRSGNILPGHGAI